MKKYLALIGASSLVLGAYITNNDELSNANRSEFILQGASIKNMVSEVANVGGQVIHEYDIIDAVSVSLSESQLSELKQQQPMLRFFKGNQLKVTGSTKVKTNSSSNSNNASDNDLASKKGKLVFDVNTNEITWTLANAANVDKNLSSINLSLPSGTSLIDLDVNGADIIYSLDNNGEITLNTAYTVAAKSAVQLRFALDELSSAYSDDYAMTVSYANGDIEKIDVPVNNKQAGKKRDTYYPSIVRANLAHQQGITGFGVTVAILDTGIRDLSEIKKTATSGNRDITIVDVLDDSVNAGQAKRNDDNGHGTHLASIILNSSETYDEFGNKTGSYNGIAPDANLVVVKAFDEEGFSSYADILQAIEYIVENKDVLNIKVLNLSFSTLPNSFYWNDPLNQALMKAWEAGITVVAAAGNRGSDAMTIGVPGNTPYVITVGAMSDNYTPYDYSDDFVSSFSSAGPTVEGFVKPELVAPGGRIQGLLDKDTLIRETFSLFDDKDSNAHNYFEMSGTSQATAVTSGIVALMLQANPDLTPDDIKCRLMATAKAATNEDGSLAYSVFQQGAGLVDAMAAIESTASACSNQGLSIAKDIAGEEHYVGPARFDENEQVFYIPGVEGLEWSGFYSDTQLWRHTSFNTDTQLWTRTSFNTDTQLWTRTSFNTDTQLWTRSSFNTDTQLWTRTSFNTDTQLWTRTSFNTDTQLWTRTSFNTDAISREWVAPE